MKRIVESIPWFLALFLCLTGCEPERPLAPPNHKLGHKVYYGYCSGCHDSGNEKIPSLREKEYLPQYTSDAQWVKSIRDGKGGMPPQGGMLQEKDIKEAIRYIRFLQKKELKKKKE